MDLSWIIGFLILVLVLAAAYFIIARFIMPAIPAGVQVFVWAVLGILMLIALLYTANGYWGHHAPLVH
jgi:TRAP-type mannitol/chloroaromatic compound transport system permease small subunit